MTDIFYAAVLIILVSAGAYGRFYIGKTIGEFLGSLIEKCMPDPHETDKLKAIIVLPIVIAIAVWVLGFSVSTMPKQEEMVHQVTGQED